MLDFIVTAVVSACIKKNIKIGEFLCSYFNIENGRKKILWHVMLYYFKKGKNATETYTYTKICAVYGEGAVTDWMCQKWFMRFHTGDFWLVDAQQSGRPTKDRDIGIQWRY